MATKNAINSLSSTVTYKTDDDNVATPNTAGVIKVLGGSNINTVSSGNAITIDGGLSTYFEALAADPAAPDDGNVWYNETTQDFKGSKAAGASAWETKAVFPADINVSLQWGASGTTEEFLVSGVQSTTGSSYIYELLTDSWSNRSGRINPRSQGGFVGSTVDEALSFGGQDNVTGGTQTTATEFYDALFDSWASLSDMNIARVNNGGAGELADALTFAGQRTGSGALDTTERYDNVGDSWTNKAVLSSIRTRSGGTGTAADALCVGGGSIGVWNDDVERYDGPGDAWIVKAVLSVAKYDVSVSGPAADALAIGGVTSTGPTVYTAVTEIYDGGLDSWAAGPSLNLARSQAKSAGSSSTDAITCAGSTGTSPGPVERLDESATIVTFTVV